MAHGTTLRFETESGSVYEVDLAERRVRRVCGKNAATRRMGTDGEWKTFVAMTPIVLGGPVMFTWRFDEGPTEDLLWGRATTTSAVQLVMEVQEEVQ